MIRDDLKQALKDAMMAKDNKKVSTVRLILAAIKDRDIAARGTAKDGVITDDDILQLLQSMIKQRRESIDIYTKGGRQDLVDAEQSEVEIIQAFLPAQMSAQEAEKAVREIVAEIGAVNLKDMGKVMTALRERYAGRMDFGQASATVKSVLGGA